ncbi:ribonuclease Y [Patescibacteria group bacterium]|nr:ribonuclease Y [Patescibacteria group bacterium]
MESFLWVLAIFGVIASFFVGNKYNQKKLEKRIKGASDKANKILEEAKEKQKKLLIEAQEKSIKIVEDSKNEISQEKKELQAQRKRLEERETLFDKKLITLEEKRDKIISVKEEIEKQKIEIEKIKEDEIKKLEEIAKLTKSQAEERILKEVENSISDDSVKKIKLIQEKTYEDMEEEAKKILMLAIQRFSLPIINDITTTNVQIPNEDMKGRIIGKEGRNIKTFEQLTGVEIVIDDTPDIIQISCFNPIRRHIAKKALDYLIADGRIQPARIEEFIERSRNELATDIKKAGENALSEVGVVGIDPKLVQILGRLEYRTSYGQNVLQHSIEVAIISGLLANEIGVDPSVCKKAGLLHDIGKAVDFEVQGTHPEIGKNIAQKFNLSDTVVKAIAEHHEDMPSTIEGVIVQVADAISGSRPGARKDTLENYVQRLQDLENIALRKDNVNRAYAISAGKEIRVFANPENINDLQALKLARDIANDIEEELKYPGEIKVTMIREKKIIEYAK